MESASDCVVCRMSVNVDFCLTIFKNGIFLLAPYNSFHTTVCGMKMPHSFDMSTYSMDIFVT